MTGRDSRAADPSLANVEPTAGGAAPGVPSFQAVYKQYFDFVWAATRRLGAPAESIDDLVQEVFIVIHAKLETLEKPEALRSWIYGVVRRVVSSDRRASRRRAAESVQGAPMRDTASKAPTPLEQTETNADLALLADLLAELDEPKREVFALVELQELSVAEAAEILAIPLNTAYSRLRLARAAFELALARHEARKREE